MNIHFETMQAAFLGGWEIVLILVVLAILIAPVALVIGLCLYFGRSGRQKSAANAASSVPLNCPQCGAILPPDAPQGLCPACLLKRGFTPEPAPPATVSRPGIVTAPAVALIIVGAWKILSGILLIGFLSGLWVWLNHLPGMRMALGEVDAGVLGGVAILSVIVFRILPAILILVGGFQMFHRRSHAWAVAAAVLAILTCSLIALPVGIWALIVLSRKDVKNAFAAQSSAGGPTPEPSRLWPVLGGTVIVMFIVMVAAGVLVWRSIGNAPGSPGEMRELTPSELLQAGIHQVDDEYRKELVQSYPLNADGQMSLDGINGQVHVYGWNSNFVAFKAVIHGKTGQGVNQIKINVASASELFTVHTQRPNEDKTFTGFWNWLCKLKNDNVNVDYEVHVPRHVRLADIDQVNGQIQIEGMNSGITARTVNGTMQITNATGSLKLSSVNGTITADMDELGDGQTVDLSTVNGRITLVLPAKVDATFSASAVNGSIDSEFSELVTKRKFPGISCQLKGTLGQGRGGVEARAVNGAINISRHPAQ